MSETERWRAKPGDYFWFIRDREAIIWRDKRRPFKIVCLKRVIITCGNTRRWQHENTSSVRNRGDNCVLLTCGAN